jgi:hypothetical protein
MRVRCVATNAAMLTVPVVEAIEPRKVSFRMLSRLRALKSSRAPARPALQHPLQDLTFFDGAIYHLRQGQPGAEYLSLSGVEVIAKISLKELGGNRCEYRFELNLAIDAVWRAFFAHQLPGDRSVRLEGRTLVLSCQPSDLEETYQRVKRAMEGANQWYAEEREALISRVIASDEEREAAREMEENRKTGLRRQFEFLEL